MEVLISEAKAQPGQRNWAKGRSRGSDQKGRQPSLHDATLSTAHCSHTVFFVPRKRIQNNQYTAETGLKSPSYTIHPDHLKVIKSYFLLSNDYIFIEVVFLSWEVYELSR